MVFTMQKNNRGARRMELKRMSKTVWVLLISGMTLMMAGVAVVNRVFPA